MRFVGKKGWIPSLIFWAVVFIAGMITGNLLYFIGIFVTLLNIGIFLCLAHYWYKLPWIMSVVVWAVAFVIDLIIVYILLILLGLSFRGGITL